jgi:hypothetical protein
MENANLFPASGPRNSKRIVDGVIEPSSHFTLVCTMKNYSRSRNWQGKTTRYCPGSSAPTAHPGHVLSDWCVALPVTGSIGLNLRCVWR